MHEMLSGGLRKGTSLTNGKGHIEKAEHQQIILICIDGVRKAKGQPDDEQEGRFFGYVWNNGG